MERIKKYLEEDKDRKMFYKTPFQTGRYIVPKSALLILNIKNKKEFLELTYPYSYMVTSAEIIKNDERKLTSNALVFYPDNFINKTGSVIFQKNTRYFEQHRVDLKLQKNTEYNEINIIN